MAGLVPAIHAAPKHTAAWMPGTRPGMTAEADEGTGATNRAREAATTGGQAHLGSQPVMAGLVPAIHAAPKRTTAWMPGTRPGMTAQGDEEAARFFLLSPSSWPGLSRPSTRRRRAQQRGCSAQGRA